MVSTYASQMSLNKPRNILMEIGVVFFVEEPPFEWLIMNLFKIDSSTLVTHDCLIH